MNLASIRIAVIGLGYVGLPVACAFARRFPGTVGFDIKRERIEELRQGEDSTLEMSTADLQASGLTFTDDVEQLRGCNFFVVTVPTPVDGNHNPDLKPLIAASETVGRCLTKGAIVVFESTVYPGVTEEICGPIIARNSGLTQGVDFKLGYSPERINPGDPERRFETILKVVSGEDLGTLDAVAAVYGSVVTAGVFKASSIKVAEAAKVIENTQRDLNIALMNELSIIFDRLGIRTKDVLDAAATKWNFLKFSPGLVGGHCIGVDPYYLTAKAEQLGYYSEVILAGRRINDSMGTYIAQRLVKLLATAGQPIKGARVAVLGLTFKENVPDLRNSRVPDIVAELEQFGIHPLVHDPMASPAEAMAEVGINLVPTSELTDLSAVVLAVAHRDYNADFIARVADQLKGAAAFIDVKSKVDPQSLPKSVQYWSL